MDKELTVFISKGQNVKQLSNQLSSMTMSRF